MIALGPPREALTPESLQSAYGRAVQASDGELIFI